jgi:hypothetical protein
MSRMDIKSWRKSRNGKAYAVRIGSTWTNDKGVTYLEFDALPLADDAGRVSCFLETPRERPAEATGGNSRPAPNRGSAPAALDDDIPFAPLVM